MSSNSTNGESKRIVPSKFAHAVLRTNKFRPMVDWYQTVLLADIVFENEFLAFMTFDDEHHRLAIAGFPGSTIAPRVVPASITSHIHTPVSVIWLPPTSG